MSTVSTDKQDETSIEIPTVSVEDVTLNSECFTNFFKYLQSYVSPSQKKKSKLIFEQIDDSHKSSAKCITTSISEERIQGWAYALSLRFLDQLGESARYYVDWTDVTDSDDKLHELKICIHTVTSVSEKTDAKNQKNKALTITLFLTNGKLLVQGNAYKHFVNHEFQYLKDLVDKIYNKCVILQVQHTQDNGTIIFQPTQGEDEKQPDKLDTVSLIDEITDNSNPIIYFSPGKSNTHTKTDSVAEITNCTPSRNPETIGTKERGIKNKIVDDVPPDDEVIINDNIAGTSKSPEVGFHQVQMLERNIIKFVEKCHKERLEIINDSIAQENIRLQQENTTLKHDILNCHRDLEEARNELRQKQKLYDDMISNMSSDIKTIKDLVLKSKDHITPNETQNKSNLQLKEELENLKFENSKLIKIIHQRDWELKEQKLECERQKINKEQIHEEVNDLYKSLTERSKTITELNISILNMTKELSETKDENYALHLSLSQTKTYRTDDNSPSSYESENHPGGKRNSNQDDHSSVTDNLGDYRGSSQSYSNRLKNCRDDQMHSSSARSYSGNQESRDNKRNSRFNLNDNPIATKNIQGNRRISKNYNLEVRKPINKQDDMTLKEKPVVVMYGDSNTYDIDPERLTGKCCISKETAYTIDEAKTLISENSDKVKPDLFLFHVGTNDLDKQSVENVHSNYKSMISLVQAKFVNTKIIISLPVPRNNQPFIQRKTQEFNQKLQNDFSENDNIYFSDLGDGRLSRGGECIPRFYKGQKHLSDQGVAILAGGLKRTIRGVLGV